MTSSQDRFEADAHAGGGGLPSSSVGQEAAHGSGTGTSTGNDAAADTVTSAAAPPGAAGRGDAAASPSAAPPMRQQFFALFSAVMLPMFLAAVDQTLLATATPQIGADLGSLGETSWMVTGYLLAATVMAPLYGRMGDRYGRRQALLAALVVFAVGSLLCALAGSMTTLVAGRVVQGLGGGGLMVLSQSLIGELVPPRDRPRYQGYFAMIFTASSVGGPVIGGFVVHHASWRWLFWANLPLVLLALWRVWRLPRAAPSALRHAAVDPAGLVLFVVTACSALLWLSLVTRRFALLSPTSGLLLATSVVAGIVLWRQQARHPNPFLPLDLLRQKPAVRWVCGSVFGFAAGLFAMVFLLPIYLQAGRSATASGAGVQMLPLTLGIVVGSWLNGRITSRTGVTGRLPAWGLTASAAAMAALALLPPSPVVTTLAAAFCGVGFGTVMPNAQLSVQLLAGRARLGSAVGLLSVTRSLGASFGTAAFGGAAFALLQIEPGGAHEAANVSLASLDPAAVTHAFHQVFGGVAVFLAVAAWVAWQLPVLALDDGEATKRG